MRLRHLGVCAVLCLVALPSFAYAQERFRTSGETQAKISSLGESAVADLSIPVLLGVEVADLTKNFGDPRGGGTRSHEGLDIIAPMGTPVAVPTDSVVTSFGNGPSSGLYVRATGAGGESFVYMHLSGIATGLQRGQILRRGDIVGFVGNTGNASGGQAHLHFEIRRNRVPADPYPRLTRTFSLSERMQSVAQALEKGASAQTSVSKFRTTFLDARAQSISIPSAIAALLDTQASPPASPPGAGTLAHDIEIVFGETNPKIITLQKFLINTQSGAAALHLKNSGATGYFGPVTKAALIEYQKATNIAATGIVDAATYAHIFVPEDEGDSSDIDDEDTAASIAFVFMRDLELGMKGEDVRALQKYLNAHGFIITQNGDGSPGYETTYFGALTRSALIRYQSQKGIAPAAGYFGPKTRASIF